ncbi:hypothetical protein E2542_SST03443 [Spatholobus suberectus]|nr:hypothetical protein E2542_SST03443 [Spatholobus suberectus]
MPCVEELFICVLDAGEKLEMCYNDRNGGVRGHVYGGVYGGSQFERDPTKNLVDLFEIFRF